MIGYLLFMTNQLLLNEYFAYLQSLRNASEHTLAAYKKDLSDLGEYFDHQDFRKLTGRQLRHYVSQLSALRLRPSTVRRKISAFKSFFKFLKKRGVIHSNPAHHLTFPKLPRKLKDIPREKELKKLQDIVEQISQKGDFESVRNLVIVELLYCTGLRRQELIDLTVESIDFYSNTIRVRGKGNKERIVPVNDYLRQLLEKYLKMRQELDNCDHSALFLTKKGKKVSKTLVYIIVKSYLGAVSEVNQKSPHMFRHAFATHLLNRGADLMSIKELLGHSSLAATQVYTQNDLQKLKSVYNRFHPRST
ncbi:integrase [Schleiferia thermophila str. Yellowstone]|nr:integrase [Schleiferia thermophila str. Yellowstone]